MAEKYVSLAEIREMLESESDKKELVTAQRSALEHSRALTSISSADVVSLREEVGALGFMTEYAAYKIGDILPKYPEDVRAIFAKERVNLSADDIKQIIDIVGKYS
jgi:DNA-directed RNA polymerase subunit F